MNVFHQQSKISLKRYKEIRITKMIDLGLILIGGLLLIRDLFKKS